jgi:hypothetical protein
MRSGLANRCPIIIDVKTSWSVKFSDGSSGKNAESECFVVDVLWGVKVLRCFLMVTATRVCRLYDNFCNIFRVVNVRLPKE